MDHHLLDHALKLLHRNQAALVAFTIPQGWKQGAGLSVVATHVDSPNLKVSLRKSDLVALMRSISPDSPNL